MNNNFLLQFYFFFTFSTFLISEILSKSIICTDNSPVQYFRIPKLHKCNYHRVLKNQAEVVRYEVFKPNIIEYVSEAKLCKKLVSEVSTYTDFSGYEHLIEKELNHNPITLAECREMIANKKCGYGTLTKGSSSGIWSTNNKIEVDYPNRFTSLFSPKRYLKENCVIIETKVYSHFNQTRPTNVLVDMNNCKYLDSSCEIKMNELIVWDVNKDQNCQYVSIGKLDGVYNNGLWINSQNQIALSLSENKTVRDCNLDLIVSDEGFAVRRNHPISSREQPNLKEISMNPQKYLKEREKYYERQRKQQEEIRIREQQNRERREQEREKYEMELEKRKNNASNTINRTKRELWQPLPLPSHIEYLKIKHDCDVIPSYDEFKKIRENCDTFPSYTDFIKRIVKYEIEKRQSESAPDQDQKENVTNGTNRIKRELYSDFQAAGEFQYLENKSNNLIRHTTEVMCDIFNEQSEILESLIRENPRRYIQKQLNHSAIRVKFIDSGEGVAAVNKTLGIVQVTFCKEIDEEEIEFVDLTHFDGYKFSLALTQGQIPINIKNLGEKIWYYKNGIISSNLQLHPMIDSRSNVTDFKRFEEFDLKFLDDKVIFHEHILLDTKTNIEEELINEMREKSDVSIELHANNQDSMIPHEILDEVESIFEKYYIKIWRVYVTIGVTLIYIFIVRSFWMLLSPKTFFDRKFRNNTNQKRMNHKDYVGLELQEMTRHPSHRSLVVD